MAVNYLRKRAPIPECLRPRLPESEYHPTIRFAISYCNPSRFLEKSPLRNGSVYVLLNPRKRKGYEIVCSEDVDFLEGKHSQLVGMAKGLANNENFLIEVVGKYLDKKDARAN